MSNRHVCAYLNSEVIFNLAQVMKDIRIFYLSFSLCGVNNTFRSSTMRSLNGQIVVLSNDVIIK